MLRGRTALLLNITTRRRKEREAARPKLTRVWKPDPRWKECYKDFGEHPVCELCQIRFKVKETFAAHKDTQLHKDRVRWAEAMEWWETVGVKAAATRDADEWAWYRRSVLEPKAQSLGVPLEELEREARRATITAKWQHDAVDYPAIRRPIQEPRDNRWPSAKTF